MPSARWLAILLVSLAASAAAAWYGSGLHVETRLEDLLPDDAPAASDYRTFVETFGGLERVFVLIEPPGGVAGDPDALAEAADRLADRLAALPGIADARSGLEPADERFLLDVVLPRAPLLVPESRLDDAMARRLDPAAVRDRVRAMRDRLLGPLGVVEGPVFAADPLGFFADVDVGGAGGFLRFVDPSSGGFVAEGGRAALVIATPAGAELDAAAGEALARDLDAAFAEVREATGTAFTFRAVGGPLYAAHDAALIRSDVVRTVTGSAVVVALLLVLYFRGVGIPLALVLSVGAAVAWTAALTRRVEGSISVVGVSFASILLGLGVDYGIHAATRFRAAALGGARRAAAMRAALAETGPAILASAATTVLAFLVLVLARFHPVRELGVVVAVGMGAILIASLGVGAPLLVLVPAGAAARREHAEGAVWRALCRAGRALVDLGERRPAAVLASATALTGLALLGAAGIRFDVDLRSLRPDDAPSSRVERRLLELFDLGLDTTTVVVPGRDLADASGRAARVESVLRRAIGPRADVVSPADWLAVGPAAAERARRFAGARTRAAVVTLESELRAEGFALGPFEPALVVLRDLATGQPPAAVPEAAWPKWIAELVRRGPGEVRVAVRVHAPVGRWPDGPPPEVVEAVERAAPGAAVASVPRLGKELRRLVAAELRDLSGWAALAIALAVLLSFRGSLRALVLAMLPVTLGSLWTVGLWGAAGVAVDPLSMAMAPLLLGIGIDDGLHALHGARAAGGIAASVRRSSRAMTLTTLTTCAGFGSLATSGVPALRHGGVLVAIGTFLCLVATLALLPALERLGSRRTSGDAPPHAPERGLAARLLGPLHVTGVFWFRFHGWGARVAPEWLKRVGVPVFTVGFLLALRNIRRGIASNLEAVLGPCGPIERERRIWRTLLTFAWCLTERYERLGTDARFEFDVARPEVWSAAASGGSGVVLVTGHLGNWEVGSALPADREERRIHVVRELELDPRAQRYVERRLTERMGARYVTHFAVDDPRLGMEMLEALRAGDVVALQGDRPRRGGKALSLRLLGRPFAVPSGPPALARAAAAPILPAFVIRTGRRRYRLEFGAPIEVARTADRAADLLEAGERIASELERAIRAHPHQWFCFRELWPRDVRGSAQSSGV